jgi:hypothetical protein
MVRMAHPTQSSRRMDNPGLSSRPLKRAAKPYVYIIAPQSIDPRYLQVVHRKGRKETWNPNLNP